MSRKPHLTHKIAGLIETIDTLLGALTGRCNRPKPFDSRQSEGIRLLILHKARLRPQPRIGDREPERRGACTRVNEHRPAFQLAAGPLT